MVADGRTNPPKLLVSQEAALTELSSPSWSLRLASVYRFVLDRHDAGREESPEATDATCESGIEGVSDATD